MRLNRKTQIKNIVYNISIRTNYDIMDEINKILCINNEGNLSIIQQDKFGKHWINKFKTIYGYINGYLFESTIILTKKQQTN